MQSTLYADAKLLGRKNPTARLWLRRDLSRFHDRKMVGDIAGGVDEIRFEEIPFHLDHHRAVLRAHHQIGGIDFDQAVANLQGRGYQAVHVLQSDPNVTLSTVASGGGAFLNGKPIANPGASDLGNAVVAGWFFKVGAFEEGARIFRNLSKKIMKFRFFGSAALDLCYLACGRVNAYIQYSVHEWDVAAALLVAELCGKRCEIEHDRAHGTMNVFASDPGIFDDLKAVIGEGR